MTAQSGLMVEGMSSQPSTSAVRTRLALEGIVAYKPGRPPVVPEGATSFKLSSNENPYPPLPSVQRAIADAASHANRYPGMDLYALRVGIAERWGVSEDQVVPGAGSSGVLQQIVSATVEAGKEVVYAWRSFEMYPILVGLAGGRSVQVPLLDNGAHDLDAMARVITSNTGLVLLCSPNNPTGAVLGHDETVAFLRQVPSDVLVVLDEAYIEFNRDESALVSESIIEQFPNVVVCRTFSKAYGLAGLRVGYGIASAEVAEVLNKTRLPFTVTDVAQEAAVASLAASEELAARVDQVIAERDRVEAALAETGWNLSPSQANFVWFPVGARTAEFAAAFEEVGLSVRPFADEGVRVTIDVPEANDELLRVADEFWRRSFRS